MSELNDFDQFNFNSYDHFSNNQPYGNIPNNDSYEINELDKLNNLNDNFNENISYNNVDNSLNNFYGDVNSNKRESERSSSNNNYSSSKNENSNKNITLPRRESKMSFENSYEQFFEKESDISDTEESNIWEIERLKRIEERKEYEKRKKIEIKEKAAEDLKKWYEEMAIKVEEKKKLFNKKKSEEKKKEENLEDKTWLKVSQYLDFEKGEYFKENSRIKQILLKLIKKENS
ncbi:conserved Plasmodium protein, unknown function [Plasmodium relictum]|uniref:Clathrin light chain n=1 Tax=Plasmodium relictum TaxID=85471 RepID=A0A1J1HE29_PLARL|nr:conserved Plasmodium protein, unknown function [Plasmodium relictum]CRH03797.1 conserved Plasmodium protein, unknown function [Plasmodium relictum]